jgi:hypothetical protein
MERSRRCPDIPLLVSHGFDHGGHRIFNVISRPRFAQVHVPAALGAAGLRLRRASGRPNRVGSTRPFGPDEMPFGEKRGAAQPIQYSACSSMCERRGFDDDNAAMKKRKPPHPVPGLPRPNGSWFHCHSTWFLPLVIWCGAPR